MIQPPGIVINIGLLLDAITAAGGLRKAAAKWRVDTHSMAMLFENKLPRLDALGRICAGAKIKPSDIISTAGEGIHAAAHNPKRQQKNGILLLGRFPKRVFQPKDAG